MILSFINNIPKSTDEMNALKTLSAGRRIALDKTLETFIIIAMYDCSFFTFLLQCKIHTEMRTNHKCIP